MSTREQTLANLADPAKVQALKDGILANLAARKTARAAAQKARSAGSKPFTKGANVAAKEAAKAAAIPTVKPSSKKVTAPVVAAPASLTGKVLENAPATDFVLTFETGPETFEVVPVKLNGEWVWSLPAASEKAGRGNAQTTHPYYVKAGRFCCLTRNSQAEQAEALRTRVRSRGYGPATAARRTPENLQAVQAWAKAVTA